MADRKNKFLLKRSNVAGKVPNSGDLLLGEMALNIADVILYTSGTTANSIVPIGWDRIHRTGDTMTGPLYTPTISATTYQNLPVDVRVTGATYNNANQFTFTNNTGSTFSTSFNTVTGLTVNGILSATTYLNLPTDIRITGGTYSNGTATYRNNTGGTFNVTGFTSNSIYTTGFTYNNQNQFSITNNTGGTLSVIANIMSGLTVNGILSATTVSANTINVPSSGMIIRNPANTFTYTVTGGAIAANRILNIPVITATDTLVVTTLAQTLTSKTLTSPVINTQISGNITSGGNVTTSNFLVGGTASQTITNKTLSASTNTHIGATHLRATPITGTTPTTGQHLVFNGTSWAPTTPSTDVFVTGGTVTTGGTLTLTRNDAVNLNINLNETKRLVINNGFPISAGEAYLGSTGAKFYSFGGTGGSDDEASYNFSVPSDYISGGTFYIKFVTTATANNVQFEMDITSRNNGGDMSTPTDTAIQNATTGSGSSWDMVETAVYTPSSSTFSKDKNVTIKINRDASDGPDTFTGTAYVWGIVFEYTGIK